MRTRICKKCGKPFECPTGQALYLCPECHKTAKLSSVYRQRICPECGKTFFGYPKSKYCPDCQSERDREAKKRYRQNSHKRKIGSIDYCEKCGKPYTVSSGRQRYCPACAQQETANNIRTVKRKYYSDNKEKMSEHKKIMRDTEYVCVICGRNFKSDVPRVTCSDECAKEQKRRLQNRAEIKRGRRKIPANEHCIHAHPSGVVGVTWCRGKWQAVWKKHYIGTYSTIDEAASAIKNYREANRGG